MTLDDALEWLSQAARKQKAERVAGDRRESHQQLPTQLSCFRGGDLVGWVAPREISREALLQAATIVIAGWELDMLTAATEAWHATDMIDDDDGEPIRPWGDHSMQYAVEHLRARERGWISDSLEVFAVNRAGDMAGRSMLYRVEHRTKLHWVATHDITTVKGEIIGGLVANTLTKAMQAPSVSVQLLQDPHWQQHERDMDPEELRAFKDGLTAQFLGQRGHAAGLNVGENNGIRMRVLVDMLPGELFDPLQE